MKFWNNWKQQNWFPYTFAAVVGVAFFMFLLHIEFFGNALYSVWVVIKPLLYGLILAYLMDPIARFYQTKLFKKMKKQLFARKVSIVLAIISVLVVAGLLIAGIIPALSQSISSLVATVSESLSGFDPETFELASILPFGLGKFFKDINISSTILESVSKGISSKFDEIADTSILIGNGFANFLIAFVLAVYYMMDKDRLQTMAKRVFIFVFKEKRYARFKEYFTRIDSILLGYIKCNFLESLIVSVINAVFMLIAGLPYVLLLSIIVGIFNLAPIFGPIVGAGIGALLLVFVNPWYALVFVIFAVVLQSVDGYVIKPRLFGETLGVAPLLILIMIILGGRVLGVVGILLAIPIAAIAQFTVDDIWKRRNEKTD